jgi:uncharacterized membrane protein
MKRISSIDIVRGIVMIIMALDHVRDLMHTNSITQSPTDLTTTTPELFLTRWITHLCAPIFVFLAGTSAYISLRRNNDFIFSRNHLLKRGLFLILLEFTVVNFGMFFDLGFHLYLFEVIAAIGVGFIFLGLISKLPFHYIGLIGLVIILLHNLFPLIPFSEKSTLQAFLNPLFNTTAIPLFSGKVFVVGYPPIPWLGIMLVGFGSGRFFELASEKRNKLFLQLSVIFIGLFVAIRFINIYGDTSKWTFQKNGLFTFLSFINVTKYPPSLLFCLLTLGIMFLLIAFGEKLNKTIQGVLCVYGKAPLFYFLVHFYLIHLITVAMLFMQGFVWRKIDFSNGSFGRPLDVASGLPLWAIYLIWIGIVMILYKPCKWFVKYKAAHKHWWLRYI